MLYKPEQFRWVPKLLTSGHMKDGYICLWSPTFLIDGDRLAYGTTNGLGAGDARGRLTTAAENRKFKAPAQQLPLARRTSSSQA